MNENVVEDLKDHMQNMQAERLYNGFASYDPLATASLAHYFDGLVTSPTGIYDDQPFFTESKSVASLAEFVGWIIREHDHDTKLLYMVERYQQPERATFESEPVTHLVRYAIIKS